TRGESIVLQLTLRYGNEESLKPYATAGDLLGRLLLRGTRTRSRQQLQDGLDRLGATLAARSDTALLSLGLGTKRPRLAESLRLLTEVLRQPALTADEFELLRAKEREGLEKARVEPRDLAGNRLQRALNPFASDDVRYVADFDEALNRL